MKKGLFLLIVTTLIAVVSCQAQKVQIDTRHNEVYALIDSVPSGALYGSFMTRMVLRQVIFMPGSVNYDFCVQRAKVVDSITTDYYDTDIKGHVVLPISNGNAPINMAYLALWTYAADSARVDGGALVNVNFDNVRIK